MNEPNKDLSNAYLQALTDNGVPEDLAEKVSEIIAKDNPEEVNLGRTDCELETVNQVLPYLKDKADD